MKFEFLSIGFNADMKAEDESHSEAIGHGRHSVATHGLALVGFWPGRANRSTVAEESADEGPCEQRIRDVVKERGLRSP